MSRSRSLQRRRGGRWVALVAGGVIVVLLGGGVVLHNGGVPAAGQAAPAATPTTDPQLVIPPRTVLVRGALAQGGQARGTVFPAYPGRNTLHVAIRWRGRAPSSTTPLDLTVTMPGMSMAPIHARLSGQGFRYGGTLTLPMFGTYRADLRLATPQEHLTGTLMLPLTLPHP